MSGLPDDNILHPVVGVLADYCAGASSKELDLAKLTCEAILPLLIDQLPQLDNATTNAYNEATNSKVADILGRISAIAGCGCASQMRESGSLQKVLPLCQRESALEVQAAATLAIQKMCAGRPRVTMEEVQVAAQPLALVLMDPSTNEIVLANVTGVFAGLLDGPDANIQTVLDTDESICSRLIELMAHPHTEISGKAVQAVGNIATGNALGH